MTEPAPELFPWLPSERVLRWLQLDAGDTELAAVAEDCRLAAASWCEDQRRDLVVDTLDGAGVLVAHTFDAGERHVQAGLLATARLYARRSSPAGLASFAELGGVEVLRFDPDVARLMGTGRYAPPAVG